MPVYWLLRRQVRVPADTGWLSEDERAVLAGLRFEKRRRDWLLGRWTAKRTVEMALRLGPPGGSLGELSPNQISIMAAPDGAPEVLIGGRPCGLNLSISHCGGVALCAVAPGPLRPGCDLERVEPRSPAFVDDYFTAAERDWWLGQPEKWRPLTANLLWSAKESALKVLRSGLRADTRSVQIDPGSIIFGPPGQWLPLRGELDGGETLQGWWRREGDRLVHTLFSRPSAPEPVALD